MALSMEDALNVFTEFSERLEGRRAELEDFLADASDEELEDFTAMDALGELKYKLSQLMRTVEMLIRETD